MIKKLLNRISWIQKNMKENEQVLLLHGEEIDTVKAGLEKLDQADSDYKGGYVDGIYDLALRLMKVCYGGVVSVHDIDSITEELGCGLVTIIPDNAEDREVFLDEIKAEIRHMEEGGEE